MVRQSKAHLVFVRVGEQEHVSLSPGDVGAGHHEHGGGVGGDEEGKCARSLVLIRP